MSGMQSCYPFCVASDVWSTPLNDAGIALC